MLVVLEKVFVDVLVPEVVQPVSQREALPRDTGSGRESPVAVEEALKLVLIRLGELPDMMSAKFSNFLTLSPPLSTFESDLLNKMHATSLTMFAFP